MITVYKALELFSYDTLVKVEPSFYCHSPKVFFGLADNILNEYEDELHNMEVELISRGPQSIHIYYNRISK